MRNAVAAIAWLVVSSFGARSTFAQVTTYSDAFQSVSAAGWIDSPAPNIYGIWPDPIHPDNRVFGFRQMRRRAVTESRASGEAIGTSSTYTLQTFSAKSFEYRGRFLRTGDARFALTFFGYRIGTDDGLAPLPNRWYAFLITADDSGGATTIRARFWEDGTPEPQTFTIQTVDAAPGRATSGRIGIWSSGGDVFIDDLSVRSATERIAAIGFYDVTTERPLDPSTLALFKTAARIRIDTSDEFSAALDGQPYTSGSPIEIEGLHSLTVSTANGSATLHLLVDTTPPVVTMKVDGAPLVDGQAFDHAVTVSAAISDVSQVTVEATLDGAPIALPLIVGEERVHQVRVRATDQVGWESIVSRGFAISRTAVQVIVVSPTPNECLSSAEVRVRGRVSGAGAVKVTLGGTTVDATVINGEFTAIVPAASEGKFDLIVAAVHIPIIIDRTRPVVEITSGGAAFTGGAFNRALSVFAGVVDADPSASLDLKLNDAPFLAGNAITADGTYILHASARDCAGNTSDDRSIEFVIDRVAPRLSAIDPLDGTSVVSNLQAIRGTVEIDDLQSAVLDGTAIEATISGRAFAFAAVGLAEGANHLTLLLTDRAGNQSRVPYGLTVKSTTPSIALVEDGSPIPSNAIFNRTVTPIVRSSEADVAISSTLNGAPFTSGNPVSADGVYTLAATATDKAGHTSTASVAFTIDRTPPTVRILSPLSDAIVKEDHVEVRISADGAETIAVNGVAVGASMSATIALVTGENVITAVATDRAGNAATESIAVTRDDGRGGIVLTIPADNVVTNRQAVAVAGQVLTPVPGLRVALNGVEVPVDASGAFHVADVPLVEGMNAITASVIADSARTAVAHVVADFTPPRLTVTASGVELHDGDRFSTPPAIALQATDERPGVTTTLTVDGSALNELTDGGHTLTAIARDAAGNETRVDRTFVIGSGGSTVCAFSNFDPPDGAAIFANTVKVAGHAGGAANVLVNGVKTYVADGSFALHVPLPHEGVNRITFACPGTSEGATAITLIRVTGAPSISIDTPARNSVTASDTIAISGSVGADVVAGDVNGLPFTPAGGRFALPKITLAIGANILVARARNGAGRIGIATTYVIRSGPPQIVITSPLAGSETGATSIDVSGIYTNVDPATLSMTAHPSSDTTGTFSTEGVALQPNASTTIAVSGRSGGGEVASASTTVQNVSGSPLISFTSPPDNTTFPASQSEAVVSGTLSPIPGLIVQVNGTQVPIDSAFRFSATISLSNGITPVIARVLTPDAKSASDNIRLLRLGGPLTVKETFPSADAQQVDPGVLAVLLFSHPIDGRSARGAISLTDSANQTLSTTLFVDNDAISVAPDVPLNSGARYTLNVSGALKDVAGSTLLQPLALSFTTAASAPATEPIVDQSDTAGCFQNAIITGKAAVVGARVRLDLDGVSTTVATAADRTFKFDLSFSGTPGYHVARVREVGGDGSLSPESTVCYRVNCSGPQVLSASLDRSGRRLLIQFSKPMQSSTLVASPGGTILLGTFTGVVALNSLGDTATVAYDSDLGTSPLALTISRAVQDTSGMPMVADYAQTFTIESSDRAAGKGYIAGAVYDATTGRPLAQAAIHGVSLTDDRGRFVWAVGEGAYILEATAAGFATAWRQAIVRAGAGTIPLDFRLTRRGDDHTAGSDLTIENGGDDATTRRATLFVPTSALSPGKHVALTAIGAQSLPAPLPLGWSPLAAAEIAIDGSAVPVPISGGRLTFAAPASDATMTVVQYDSDHDEWRVVTAAAIVANDGRVSVDLLTSGDYALVYPDRGPALAHPPVPHSGGTLQGVADPCVASPDICRPVSRSFVLDPAAIPPNGRTVATLTTDGTKPYPSGTAIQATIDEQLNLADGRTMFDPPFMTDLLLYRTLAGDSATAVFHLAPSAHAAGVTLRDGVDHIRINDYPGRIDRGALIGAEGGRVGGGEMVSLEIPTGATSEPIRASVVPVTEFSSFGAVAGFQIAGGFTLSLARAGDSTAASLLKPARATVTVESSKFATTNRQVVIAEVLGQTPFGTMVRLAAIMQPATAVAPANVAIFATRIIDTLPLDGIIHDGSYLILTADAPIAFAFGQVRLGSSGPTVAGALVSSPTLGLKDLARIGGVFVIPVPAKPSPPFALRARSIATGDGALATAASSPDAGAIVPFGDLILSVQPPHLVSLTPADGATLDPGAPFLPQAVFDMPIDPTSVAAAFVITNVPGTVDSAGSTVTFHPAEALRPATQYSITILPTLRGSNGAPFGRTAVAQFSTRNLPEANTAMRPELIRITIPDAAGVSIISGRAGALPAGSQAIAVRRNRNFVTQYQATAGSDGAFSFSAGTGADAIATTDSIDLQIIDAVSHAIIGVIPLTPFTTADGNGFLSPPNADVHFVSPGAVAVDVPAGAFELPTVITLTTASTDLFAFAHELTTTAGVTIQFNGVAKKRIDVELPIPPNTDMSKPIYLGLFGQSIRGPRVMIVDTLRSEGGHFTTRLSSGGSSASLKPANTSQLRPSSVLTGQADVKAALLGVITGGTYTSVSLNPPTSWSVFDGLSSAVDLFWDSMPSLYASSLYLAEGHGRVLIPVEANRPFTVEGVDASTGLQAFRRLYDPQSAGDPLAAIALPSPIDNSLGPYPVFASPARIEVMDIPAEDVVLTSVRNFELLLRSGMLRVTTVGLAAGTRVEVLNTSTGNLQVAAGDTTSMPASVGDRILLLIGEENVDPNEPIAIAFNKPIAITGDPDNYIHSNQLLRILSRDPRTNAAFADVTAQVTFDADSGNRRITVRFNSPLQLGKQYRLSISRNIGDTFGVGGTTDLRLGQRRVGDSVGPLLSDDLHVDFSTREPGGSIASFDLRQGAVRDLALAGNIALVSALDGGLQAFDVSDPAALDASNNPRPMSSVPAGATEFWAVAADRHGRIYTTGLGASFGVLRTYRLSDFLAGQTVSRQIGSATVSWRPGINSNVPLGTETVVGDRAEATPRKLQIVLQDADPLDYTPVTLISTYSGTSVDLGGGFQKISITIRGDRAIAYQTQRVTVENRALDLRWSVDVPRSGAASIVGIIARSGDHLFVVRNQRTYGVISLFGYGISVFDLNAVESNDVSPPEANYQTIQEQVALSKGTDPTGQTAPCDPAQSAATGATCPIRDLAFSPEALIRASASSSALKVFALDAAHGVLDLNVAPPSLVTPASAGLTLASPFIDQPRLRKLRELYRTVSGRQPFAHFTSIASYKNLALIAANQFGLIAIRLDGGALDWQALVDVVWIPAGAFSVRAIPDSDIAVVVDGAGRVLLIDLKRIDESSRVAALPTCTSATCSAELFPTARSAITSAAEPLPPGVDWAEVGADDPRIMWKSAPHLVRGTLAPLIDPGTGFLFTGDVNTSRMGVVAAIDPRLRILVNDGRELGEATGIVPLGVDPPPNIVTGVDGSLAAFRVEATLPSGVRPRLAVESEIVSGFASAPTPPALPRAHLRNADALALTPVIPPNVLTEFPMLRFQRGANRLMSPWIVALADPRAAKRYVWPPGADKVAAGCNSCDRPHFLQDDNSAIEIYTTGRYVSIHVEEGVFSRAYDYLNAAGRLSARVTTIPADTIRPAYVVTAAQDPALAGGALQSSVLLHSGELVEQSIDLDAGGRAGWNVTFDRTFRSRSIGGASMGLGWEASMFRRLRALPNGNVEYRDATGEGWLFRRATGGYVSPRGLYLRLTKTLNGWELVDQKQRITTFDALGRLSTESDVFYDGHGGGNIIRYIYDSAGRLTAIVDPVGRVSTIAYDAQGLLKNITDWRGRSADYAYDAEGRLSTVTLPATKNPGYLQFDHASPSTRPKITYRYQPAASDYNAALELGSNLRSIQEPDDLQPRVTFDFYDSGNRRDMLQRETWGTTDHASATFDYTIDSGLHAASGAVVIDALRQRRTYSISGGHFDRIVESAIPVWSAAAFGSLPAAVLATSSDTASIERTFEFLRGADGEVITLNHAGVSSTAFGYAAAGTVGLVLRSRVVTAAVFSVAGLTQNFDHAGPFLSAIESEGARVDAPEPRRDALTLQQSDGGVTTQSVYNNDGLLREAHTLPPVAPAAGSGEKATNDYFPPTDASLHRRAQPRIFTAGDDLSTTVDYPDADTEVRNAPRGVQTRVEYDELRRPIHINVTGGAEEWFAYDARGRLARRRRRQGNLEPEERYEYDAVGRLKRSSIFDGGAEVEATQYEYDLPSRLTRTILPAGGIITSVLDGLGRVTERRTDPRHPFATMTVEETRYDADDNVVFTSDGRSANATRFDAAHRAVETIGSDLTRTKTSIDGWGRLRESRNVGTGSMFKADFTPGGKLKSTATNTSTEEYGWDAAGRTRSVVRQRGESEAVTKSTFDFDTAGRLLDEQTASGDGHLFAHTQYAYNGADVPSSITSLENRDRNSSSWSLDHNTLGQSTRIANTTSPAFVFSHAFDEAGNLTSSKTPRRPGTFHYKHEARGLTTDEILPNTANPNHYDFGAGGAMQRYVDPESEPTRVTNDGLGRPVSRTYADGSTEEVHYDADQVIQTRDRQGRVLNYSYNVKGQLEQIRGDGGVLDELTYDIAGRLIGWKSEGTKIEYDDFDADNRPQTTRQIRYRSDGTELDRYTQRHTWNGDGVRTSWTLPSSTVTVFEEHDAMGNVSAIRRSGAPSPLMTAEYRTSGRPISRTINGIVRKYDYDDVGRLTEMQVLRGNQVLAGSRILFDGLLRKREQHLGIAGDERYTNWTYDDRGRLSAMIAAADQDVAPSVLHELTDADFQTRFTPKPGGGHKIGSMLYQKADGTDGGSQRTEDSRFRYVFDERGRLRRVTDHSGTTRVVYTYNAMDRMVGRRLEVFQENDWKLKEAPESSITFVWDPVSDQLIEMFEAEKYESGAVVPSGRLLRQFIHGGLGYDDPIEVFDGVHRYYPVIDEAGNGSLQAVLDESGKLISRTIIADPYGEDAEAINAPAVDKITVKGTKDTMELKVSMHLTEPIDPSTIGGVRLAPTTATPTATDAYTIMWTLAGVPASSLTIEGAESLRSLTFGPAAPVLFPGYTINAADIAQRFASTAAGATFTSTPYNITSLAQLGTRDSTDITAALVMSPFKAHPYVDPFTGLDYVRARWVDRGTGTFISADPLGYADSANLYAFCGGDPVNCQDATGEGVYLVYRPINDVDLKLLYPVMGHVYLAFDGEGLEDPARWARLVARIGSERRSDITRAADPDAETFSFHPIEVKHGDRRNSLVRTAYTRGSYIGYNDTKPDQEAFRDARRAMKMISPIPFIKFEATGGVKIWQIAASQRQQERLYISMTAERRSINSGLNEFGSYLLGLRNCGTWVQSMLSREGLAWPFGARFLNLGAGVGGPVVNAAYAPLTGALAVVGETRRELRSIVEAPSSHRACPREWCGDARGW